MPAFKLADGVWRFGEGIGSINDWLDLAGLCEFLEHLEVAGACEGNQPLQGLANERRQEQRPEWTADSSKPAAFAFATDDHKRSLGAKRPTKM
jgi:hypothetical protein